MTMRLGDGRPGLDPSDVGPAKARTRTLAWLFPLILILPSGLLLSLDKIVAQGPPQHAADPSDPIEVRKEAVAHPVGSTGSVQDALLKPYLFPFRKPTPLSEVCEHLRKTLKIRVVLDHAALERQQVKESTTVKLDLDGARLKTGLKLLLDQAHLTYKVVPEDNLLIVTDTEGADDPVERVAQEMKALHLEVHDLRDAVEDIRSILGGAPLDEEPNPKMRNPTIIEEVPPGEEGARPKGKVKEENSSHSRPGI